MGEAKASQIKAAIDAHEDEYEHDEFGPAIDEDELDRKIADAIEAHAAHAGHGRRLRTRAAATVSAKAASGIGDARVPTRPVPTTGSPGSGARGRRPVTPRAAARWATAA